MASIPDPTLSKPKFLNWVKAALAVLFTKEEIEPVVCDEIVQFQQKCLRDISISNGLSAGSTCSSCNTENIVVCPTNRICNVNRGKCGYHRNFSTMFHQSCCPNKICHNMRSQIQKAHRFYGPSFKNTDATQWCSNPWEIAKCFMPPDGYKDVMSAVDTDFNGIISVIVNFKGFETKINDDLSKKNNIFDKGRNVGKDVRHSPKLEVEDADLTQYFTILNDILTDPGFIALNKAPNNAIQKLAKLQLDELIIGKDVVRTVLEDVGNAIQEQIRNEIDEFEQKTEKQNLELIEIINLKVKDIEDEGNISFSKLKDTFTSSIDALEAKVQKAIQEIEEQKTKEERKLKIVAKEELKTIREEGANVIKEIHEAAEQPRGTDADAKLSEETYQKRTKGNEI
ncbi:uncharacterized protein LOC132737791 [Ruditapes philippinarum]|uniref:uncharacterized protein LOC132737791 n=1 Tax=Ruditapes philippinarum TaxID=129788 RepID=UPI00295A5962|nr:uncharacterized protein LOC132737791 [Ruditapes philippinarum]